MSYDKTLAIKEESNFYPFGLKQEGYNTVKIGFENKYKYNGKELQDDSIGGWKLNLYDYGARNYDPAIGRWMNIDPLADTYTSVSPYNHVLNNPVFYVDPDGKQIDISGIYKQDKKGNDILDKSGNRILIGLNISVTGKLINESGKVFTSKELSSFATRLSNSIKDSFSSGSEKGFAVNVTTDITVASSANKLNKTDHAFRIVDNGKLPDSDNPGSFRPMNVIGHASFGELGVYINADIVSNKMVPAKTGKYAGTGKTSTGDATLERTGSHELGHTGTLPHVTPGTMDSNLMHQTSKPNAGMELTKAQILQMKEAYDKKLLNKGRQKY
ncbi:RHS repeat domain-containing protein [Flavobacterium sp. HTF]|uniref:RHS repeat domain-containing protein n=1 Tax=Flavobacterium sp. HTF TaxID=2170732 RepID=UPI001FAF9D6E|nr:RHS repeat-associated core domain-containing protein [Flavobacterium sp. HTF]